MLAFLAVDALAQVPCSFGAGCAKADNVYVEPDTLYAVQGARYTLTSSPPSSCDPWIDAQLDGWLTGVSIPTPNFYVFGAALGVPEPFEIGIEVEPDVVAGPSGVERLKWKALDSCSSYSDWSRICIIPESDAPTFVGWSGPQAMWTHTLTGAADFEGRAGRESVALGSVDDQCWDAAVAAGQQSVVTAHLCSQLTSLTTWPFNFDASNTTDVIDYTGYNANCVEAYRVAGVVPCQAVAAQPMEVACSTSNGIVYEVYDGRMVKARITATQVGAQKGDGSWYWQSWP